MSDEEIKRRISNSERMAAWRKANPERFNEAVKRSKAKAKANMTEEQREEARKKDRVRYHLRTLASNRPDSCEVCGSTNRIVLDHCHNSGKFRGWICDDCNVALGRTKDNPTTLRALAEYLERSR